LGLFISELAGCLFLALLYLVFACYLQLSVLGIACYPIVLELWVPQFTVKCNLGVFLCKFARFGLFFLI